MRTWRKANRWVGEHMSVGRWLVVWLFVALLGATLFGAGLGSKTLGLWIPGLVLVASGVLGMYGNSLRL